jgi:hypothetical protein
VRERSLGPAIAVWAIVMLLLLSIGVFSRPDEHPPPQPTFGQLLEAVERGDIRHAVVHTRLAIRGRLR